MIVWEYINSSKSELHYFSVLRMVAVRADIYAAGEKSFICDVLVLKEGVVEHDVSFSTHETDLWWIWEEKPLTIPEE